MGRSPQVVRVAGPPTTPPFSAASFLFPACSVACRVARASCFLFLQQTRRGESLQEAVHTYRLLLGSRVVALGRPHLPLLRTKIFVCTRKHRQPGFPLIQASLANPCHSLILLSCSIYRISSTNPLGVPPLVSPEPSPPKHRSSPYIFGS